MRHCTLLLISGLSGLMACGPGTQLGGTIGPSRAPKTGSIDDVVQCDPTICDVLGTNCAALQFCEVEGEHELGSCAPIELATAEDSIQIEQLDGGWDAWRRPFGDSWTDPDTDMPFGFTDPSPCLELDLPDHNKWCEQRVLDADGSVSRERLRSPDGTETTTHAHGLIEIRNPEGQLTLLRDRSPGGYGFSHRWVYGELGRPIRHYRTITRHDGTKDSHVGMAHMSCDGRIAHMDYLRHQWHRATGPTVEVDVRTRYLYDDAGRLMRIDGPWLNDPLWEDWRFAYDPDGTLRAVNKSRYVEWALTVVDRSGQAIAEQYSNAGWAWVRWYETGPFGWVNAREALRTDVRTGSTLTVRQHDPSGKLMLAWVASDDVRHDTQEARHQRHAEKRTYTCDGVLSRVDTDYDQDGVADKWTTWTLRPDGWVSSQTQGRLPDGTAIVPITVEYRVCSPDTDW